jgi:hypothetical protein
MVAVIPPRCAVALATGSAFLLGCGDAGVPAPASDRDAAAEAQAVDSGQADVAAPGSKYPSFTPGVGQIVRNAGDVMRDSTIVSITWNSDPSQSLIDTFVDGIGASSYWQAVGRDYGVGTATSGAANHVHMGASPPASLVETSDANSDVRQLVLANVGTTWPAPTRNTIYALFLPPGTTLLVRPTTGGTPSDICHQGIAGYHSAMPAAGDGPPELAYTVIPSCRPHGSPVPQLSTIAMGHELVESATDPYGADRSAANVGWYGFDDAHFAFAYFNQLQGEVGDVCELTAQSFTTGGGVFPYLLPRIWSNSSGAAGHDPCIPAPPGPYFNVTPLGLDDVQVTVPGTLTGGATSTFTTRGVRVPEGRTATFTLGFYSDGPTGGAWTIDAVPGNPVLAGSGDGGDVLSQANPSQISAALDKTSGQDGDTAQVTVTVASTGKAFGGELLTITSTLNGVVSTMPVWIGGR